jgi:DNA polymerase III delta prime subunit
MAKALNCTGADGYGQMTSAPCGKCQACTEIDAGRFVDYIEMDAASNRGVDEMVALLEKAAYAPSSARFKVYMIDEVHMLTSQNNFGVSHSSSKMLKHLFKYDSIGVGCASNTSSGELNKMQLF